MILNDYLTTPIQGFVKLVGLEEQANMRTAFGARQFWLFAFAVHLQIG
jgi:hypothetical protein